MRALLPLLACLMLVVTGLSSLGHAAETPAGEVTAIEQAWHSQGDGDEVPGDADKATPHHHATCHGHDLATPVRSPAAVAVTGGHCTPVPAMVALAVNSASDTPLRPPMA